VKVQSSFHPGADEKDHALLVWLDDVIVGK
jgi:hypothetical protein